MQRRIFKSLQYIKNNKIVLPPTLSKITVVHYRQGLENSGVRHFLIENEASIKLYNPNLYFDTKKIEAEGRIPSIVLQFADGSQRKISINKKETGAQILERVKTVAEEMRRNVDEKYAQYLKDFNEQVGRELV